MVLALALLCAGSAAAASITFDGEVLRYRAEPEESGQAALSLYPLGGSPTHLQLATTLVPDVGSGCGGFSWEPGVNSWAVQCALGSPTSGQPRYQLSFDGHAPVRARVDDVVRAAFRSGLRGVVYAGEGDDFVEGDRVYGGPGDDTVEGTRVYGGAGHDTLYGTLGEFTPRRIVLRGGSDGDILTGPGHLYGGPGDDQLHQSFWSDSQEMLVGGPGRDVVTLFHQDNRERHVVRLRKGGQDRVACGRTDDDPKKVRFATYVFVDRTDRIDSDCPGVRVLLTGRPRYPYP